MGETIRQTFNLYNTVGLIDKDKNIYFVPHQADIYAKVTASRTKVCDCYYELFNTVSPFSSKYQNTEISQWSPEDRRLVIEGTIDDFRQSRGQGLALNYLIMNRAIYEVNGETETLISNYYYAMFIDSVEQVGSRSVKLNLTPDYFTNFYYLNNNDTLTSTYDPFNPVMKNCFIERQHYDRFENVNNTLRFKNLEKILLSEESFKYRYQYKDKRLFLPIGVDISLTRYETICNSLKGITTLDSFKTFFTGLSNNERKMVVQLFTSYLNVIFKEPVTRPISYNLNSKNYYFRAGYTTYNNVNLPFIHCVVPFISIPKGYENIKRSWLKIGLDAYVDSTHSSFNTTIWDFYEEQNYNPSIILNYLQQTGANQYVLTAFISKYSPVINDYYKCDIETSNIRIRYHVGLTQTNSTEYPDSLSPDTYLADLNQTISLTTDTFTFLSPSYVKHGAGFETNRVIDNGTGLYGEPNDPSNPSGTTNFHRSMYTISGASITLNPNVFWYTSIEGQTNYNYYYPLGYFSFIMIVLAKYEIPDFNISFTEQPQNIKTSYIEPILNADPYTLYGISINETEQIISKFKLVESYNNLHTFNFNLKPILSANETYKVGLIPSFYIGQKWERYYSDSIVISLSSQLPIIEDSWLTFYVNNKAQMKNQYAVQKNNFESSMVQGAVSTYGDIADRAIKGYSERGKNGGLLGGLSGLIRGVTNLSNTAIANRFQIANIELSQKAKMSDMGARPDTVKLAGSDLAYDLLQNELGFYINHYTIDETSYKSCSKYLERFGYLVNIFDSINPFNRIGFNYIKITSFDFVEDDFVLSQEQMEAISKIFEEGVTLLHNHDYLHNLGEVIGNVSYHNYELALE